jgi:hypothetical protein
MTAAMGIPKLEAGPQKSVLLRPWSANILVAPLHLPTIDIHSLQAPNLTNMRSRNAPPLASGIPPHSRVDD